MARAHATNRALARCRHHSVRAARRAGARATGRRRIVERWQDEASLECRAAGDEQRPHVRVVDVVAVFAEREEFFLRHGRMIEDDPAVLGDAQDRWNAPVMAVVQAFRKHGFSQALHVRMRRQQYALDLFAEFGVRHDSGQRTPHDGAGMALRQDVVEVDDAIRRCRRHAVVGNDDDIDLRAQSAAFETADQARDLAVDVAQCGVEIRGVGPELMSYRVDTVEIQGQQGWALCDRQVEPAEYGIDACGVAETLVEWRAIVRMRAMHRRLRTWPEHRRCAPSTALHGRP